MAKVNRPWAQLKSKHQDMMHWDPTSLHVLSWFYFFMNLIIDKGIVSKKNLEISVLWLHSSRCAPSFAICYAKLAGFYIVIIWRLPTFFCHHAPLSCTILYELYISFFVSYGSFCDPRFIAASHVAPLFRRAS